MAYWDFTAVDQAVLDYVPHYSDAVVTYEEIPEEDDRVRSQNEESAYRRYNPQLFPLVVGPCETCHESVWSDQGHVYVDVRDEYYHQLHHDDCYNKGYKIVNKTKRTAKLELEKPNDNTANND